MDDCVFKFVLVICVENDTALVYKAHDWRDPAGAPQEVYDDVEKPVLDDESAKFAYIFALRQFLLTSHCFLSCVHFLKSIINF